jgi:hypothetical protein
MVVDHMLAPRNSCDDTCSIDSDDTMRTEIADLAPSELRLPSLSDLLLTGFCSPTKFRLLGGGEPAKTAANASEVSTPAPIRKNGITGHTGKPDLHVRETGPASSFFAQFFSKPTKASHSLDLYGEGSRTGDEAMAETVAEPEDNDHDDELTSQETVPFSIFSFRVLEVLVFTVLIYCVTYTALQALDKELVFEFTPKSQHRGLEGPYCDILKTPSFGVVDQVDQ